MKYDIYQINLTNEEYDAVNSMANPHNDHAKFIASRNVAMEEFEKGKEFYTKVAEIEANDLEHVFHIGNMGPEELITRLDRMHSLSVGDIVVDGNGIQWGVASIGFTEVQDIV